ncbi:hypothetical protein LTR22_017897 [Elasticomyces elasticus]|nr:hypothetical protein LTR22_017897 [Elasticomyces elasticus]
MANVGALMVLGILPGMTNGRTSRPSRPRNVPPPVSPAHTTDVDSPSSDDTSTGKPSKPSKWRAALSRLRRHISDPPPDYASLDSLYCSACSDVHRTLKFSKAEQEKTASERCCMLAERKIVVCRHHSLSLLALKRVAPKNPEGWTCPHRNHAGANGAPPCATFKISSSSPTTGHSSTISTQVRLGPGCRLFSSNTEHAWMIRRQVDRLAVRMCPHASTTDDTVFMRYDNGKDYGSAITSGNNSTVRSCRERECTMRYWFSPGSDEDGGDAIWLNVVHREMPWPLAADHEAWLAAST